MKLRLVALALLIAVLLTVALTAAWDRRELRPGEAWLRLHDGARAAVADDGGPFQPVDGDQRLGPGDRVRIESGGADLELARDVDVEMRTGTDITVDRTPTLHAGDALAMTAESSLRIGASPSAVAVVAPHSVARVSRGLAFGTSAYQGAVALHSVGRQLDVPALRQGAISAVGAVAREASPILVDPDDEWDRRYLGAAIDLTRQLDAVSTGFSANVVTSFRPVTDVVLEAIPSAAPSRELDEVAGASRRPGELLVGAVIATAAEVSPTPVFDFRDRGATWGLVALDQRIEDADTLFALLRLALDDAPLLATSVAAPSAGESASASPSPGAETARSAPGSGESTERSEPSEPSERDDPTGAVDDVIEETTETLDGTVDGVEEVVGVIVEESEALLDEPLPAPAPLTSEPTLVEDPIGTVEDTVDETVDGVTGTPLAP